MKFSPCNGDCTELGTHCHGCERSHHDIEAMRQPVEALVKLAQKKQYENLDEFANAVADSIRYQLGMGH